MKCRNKGCDKEATIKVEPNRHACSPNSINWNAKKESEKYYEWYCSKECCKKDQDLNYALWAEMDQNASDSECFEHLEWRGDARFGRCKVTKKEYLVYPLCPSNSSGQPSECTKHFKLRAKYQEILDNTFGK